LARFTNLLEEYKLKWENLVCEEGECGSSESARPSKRRSRRSALTPLAS
jgi:hypothetical protein